MGDRQGVWQSGNYTRPRPAEYGVFTYQTIGKNPGALSPFLRSFTLSLHSIIANPRRTCPRRRIDLHPDLPACAGCGRCCHLVVELRPGDRVPEELVVEHAGARCMDQRGNGACVALDPVTLLCTIYDERPQTCRDFQRGENLCRKILSAYARKPSPS